MLSASGIFPALFAPCFARPSPHDAICSAGAVFSGFAAQQSYRKAREHRQCAVFSKSGWG